jgi:2'-5' RNA ligase
MAGGIHDNGFILADFRRKRTVMHRLFVAIRPPDSVLDLLIDAMDDSADFRWQDETQLHLTLRFIGEVQRPLAEDLAAALEPIRSPRFALRIAGTGRFDQSNSGALWAGVEPKEPVAALAAKVERACQSAGLPPERRAFHPHITLARWKGPRSREAAGFLERSASLASDPFEVDHFLLFESRLSRHGAHYEEVARYPLG